MDRFEIAAEVGARYARDESLVGLAKLLTAWGIDGASFLRTIARFNSGVLLPDDPPRRLLHDPLIEPPFHALEVQPAITFTHGGIRIDDRARVLGLNLRPIPGLLAAGADAGGVYHKAYAGGLAVALALGMQAAATAIEAAI